MLKFNYNAELQHYPEKYNSNDIINDINIIENSEKNEYLKPYSIKNNTDDYQYAIININKTTFKHEIFSLN